MYSDEEVVDLERIQEGVEEIPPGSDNEDEQNDENEGDQAEEANDTEKKDDVKPKRVIKNPQPKLNVDSLKGKKGLLALQTHFANVKFQGHGHEEEDLRKIMKTYEYWCHRLFPKYSFDDCIAKLESLGKKKSVQILVKRVRFDLLMPDEDQPPQLDNSDNEQETSQQISAEAQFDDMQGNQQITSDTTVTLTDEQLELIRLNRERALQIRQEKLKAAKEKAQKTLITNNLETSQQITSHTQSHDDFPSSDDELIPAENMTQLNINENTSSQLSKENNPETNAGNENIETDILQNKSDSEDNFSTQCSTNSKDLELSEKMVVDENILNKSKEIKENSLTELESCSKSNTDLIGEDVFDEDMDVDEILQNVNTPAENPQETEKNIEVDDVSG